MDTMDWKLEIKLVGPEGTQREELFLGRDAHDLAMLGAAQGYLQGLYKAAEPASLLGAAAGMAETIEKILHPRLDPGPGPVMGRPATTTQLVGTELGLIEITGMSPEAVSRAAELLAPPAAEVLKRRLEQHHEEIMLILMSALERGLVTREDLEELAGKPA